MKKNIQLSKRLQTVVELVTKGKHVADVGCDHACPTIEQKNKMTNCFHPFYVKSNKNEQF